MAIEQKRAAVVDPDRLECRAAPQQRLVIRGEHGLVDRDQTPACDRDSQERHAGTRPPTAARSGRALTHDSSISASGSESQTIPPPTQR